MKASKQWQWTVAIAGLVWGLEVGANGAFAQAPGTPEVVQPSVNEFGNPYAEWSARWWQWLLSIPADKNPNLDKTGAHCAEGQTGQVWFLAGTFGTPPRPPLTRSCTVPGGKDLFLTPLATLFGQLGPVVGDCTDADDCDMTALRKQAAAGVDNPQLLEVSVDGVKIQNVAQHRVTSPVFNAFFPEGAIFNISAGTHGPLVSDGYWILLKPLSPGAHTIHFKGVGSNGFTVEVTYLLTVTQ
jgi:hypothetical protein